MAIFDLEFDVTSYYIERDSIVEKTTFNNRTFYSRFETIKESPSPTIIQQHLQGEVTIALPLVNSGHVNYLVLEYKKEENNRYFHLIKHLLKSMRIETFHTYENPKNNHIQIFVPRKSISIEHAYEQIENIKHQLEIKSSKYCKLYPDKNLPKNYNKITLPMKKM